MKVLIVEENRKFGPFPVQEMATDAIAADLVDRTVTRVYV